MDNAEAVITIMNASANAETKYTDPQQRAPHIWVRFEDKAMVDLNLVSDSNNQFVSGNTGCFEPSQFKKYVHYNL